MPGRRLDRLAFHGTLLAMLFNAGSGWFSPAYGQAGQAGLSFLKLGTSARGIAMADAMAGFVQGPASISYNPAGLAARDSSSSTELLFTHREWIEDTRVEFLAGSARLADDQAIGFAVTSTTVSDIELRTRPGEAEGTFTARNFAAIGSYARSFNQNLALGIAVKFLYEKILIDEASGFAVDLGARMGTPLENLNVGVALANLGSMNSLRSEATTLPAMLRVGPAYSYGFNEGRTVASIASDLLYVFPEKRTYLNLGGEVEFERTVAIRVGYQFGSEGRGLTSGIGLRYGIFCVDYAYAKLSEDLGNTHSFTLGITP